MEHCFTPSRRFSRRFSLAAALALAFGTSGLTQGQTAPAQEKKTEPPKTAKPSALKTGLYINDPKAFQGYTLFSPLNYKKTFLIDMEGKVVHVWEGAATPGSCAVLLENGHLLRPCLYEATKTPFGTGGGAAGRVQEFTWEGDIVWDFEVASDTQLAHHDVRKMPNGNLLMIVGEMKSAEEAAAAGRKSAGKVRADCVFEVKPTGKTTGEIVWQWRMWDHLIQDADQNKANFGDVAAHPELIDVNFGPGGGKSKGAVDWTHTNAIDYNVALNQIMISVHNFSEVWIIDHGTSTAEAAGHAGGKYGKGGDLLYRWGNPVAYRAGAAADQQLFAQHNTHWIPEGLPGAGHVLVFNNRNAHLGPNASSVDEFLPPTEPKGRYARKPGSPFGPEKALWTYFAPKKTDFFSGYISGAQRLPNGNTLICSGADGIFFEVTADGDVLWKYVNPLRGPAAKGGGAPTAGAVFRAYRYASDYRGLAGRDVRSGKTIEEQNTER